MRQLLRGHRLMIFIAPLVVAGCGTLPEPKFKRYEFPDKDAFVNAAPAGRTYRSLGIVRTRVDYAGMIQEKTEDQLCANYYNKGARDLLRKAKRELQASAIINVRTVVFYMNGKKELHRDPQCAEDEAGGQILMQAEAVRWTVRKSRPPPAP